MAKCIALKILLYIKDLSIVTISGSQLNRSDFLIFLEIYYNEGLTFIYIYATIYLDILKEAIFT